MIASEFHQPPDRELVHTADRQGRVVRTADSPFNPPAEAGTCDECGGDLYHREDDQEETARERLRVYQENTQPLIEFYRTRGELIEIDGEQSIDAVWEDVKTAVQSDVE